MTTEQIIELLEALAEEFDLYTGGESAEYSAEDYQYYIGQESAYASAAKSLTKVIEKIRKAES